MKKMRTRKYNCQNTKGNITEFYQTPEKKLIIRLGTSYKFISERGGNWIGDVHSRRQVKLMVKAGQEFLRKTEPKMKQKILNTLARKKPTFTSLRRR